MMNELNQTRPQRTGDLLPVRFVSCSRLASSNEPASMVYDFGGTYPIKEMRIDISDQNHHEVTEPCDPLYKNLKVEHSLCGREWMELDAPEGAFQFTHTSIHFGNVIARFVRISLDTARGDEQWIGDCESELRFDPSAIQFYVGHGLVVEPEPSWDDLFLRTSGWSGSDGIYSIPVNGDESAESTTDSETLFLFGDTFIGEVDPESGKRLTSTMVNNTMAVLTGTSPSPEKIRFLWNEDDAGQPVSMLTPSTLKTKLLQGTWYWLQDGTSIRNHFYCFPLMIGPNPDGPEGFQFTVHGITRVSMPIRNQGLVFDEQKQVDTPLYFKCHSGETCYFGAAIMPNTHEANAPAPDDFVYVYGLQQAAKPRLIAARVPMERFEDFDSWQYWDGRRWNGNREMVSPIAPEVSCELSVSPMCGGFLDGKYVVASLIDNHVSLYVGDSPVGPFDEYIPLYHCAEPDDGNGIYAYNAKGHPHLSANGELLISYNVNSTKWDMHMEHGDLYRPRFVRLRQISRTSELER